MAIQDLTADVAEQLGYQDQTGVIIIAVARDSIAAFSGLGPGMLIQQVDQQPVHDLRDFTSKLKEAARKPPVLFLVDYQGAYRYLVLAVPQQ